jgi:hypothetical protein
MWPMRADSQLTATFYWSWYARGDSNTRPLCFVGVGEPSAIDCYSLLSAAIYAGLAVVRALP